MIFTWLSSVVRRRTGRVAATATGIAVAVALIAALGTFLAQSSATMTSRALRTVAVDWQVEVQRGSDPAAVGQLVAALPGSVAVQRVQLAATTGLRATVDGTTQTTGPGMVLGLPPGYRSAFPDEIRPLSGATSGVLLAQQTAANLHARPGDTVYVGRDGRAPVALTIAGVVDLPQADTLFQRVGAPTQSQPTAPPDNVIILPAETFRQVLSGPGAAVGDVVTQFHVRRATPSEHDPGAAYAAVVGAAHNLEARLAGTGLVGDNVGAALDAARSDALYAQIMFLFLGLPGVVLAALLTAAVVSAGSARRRSDQALLRVRGLPPGWVVALAAGEALLVGLAGGAAGIALAAVVGRRAASGLAAGGNGLPSPGWAVVGVGVGLTVALVTVMLPAVRGLRLQTVVDARRQIRRTGTSWWRRIGLDLQLLGASLVVFRASGADNYSLVLAPEGVARISVSYWALFGPVLFWLGAALLLWRLADLFLLHGRRSIARVIRPLTGNASTPGAASISRQRGPIARAMVLLALAISFAASTAVFNDTYTVQAEADAQLTNGADVTVTESPGRLTGPEAATALSSVRGVRHVEPLQHRFAYVGADLQDLYGVQPASIASATALQDGYFVGGTARALMARLQQAPDSVLVSDETVKDFLLSPGDVINLRLRDERTKQLRTIAFHYAGIVKEFPTAPKDSFFVANAAYVAQQTGSGAVGAFLVDTGGTDQTRVAAELRHRLGTTATVTEIATTRLQVGSSLTSVNLTGLTRIELLLAVLLAAGAGAIVLGVGLAERRRSLAIMAVLGARRAQLRGLVLAEAGLLAIGGLAGGAAISWALSAMLVKVLTGVFDPPPDTMAVPWGYLGGTVAAVLAALLAAALVGARTSTRPAIEELREL